MVRLQLVNNNDCGYQSSLLVAYINCIIKAADAPYNDYRTIDLFIKNGVSIKADFTVRNFHLFKYVDVDEGDVMY